MCSIPIAMLAMTAVSAYGQIQQGNNQAQIASQQANAVNDQAQRVNEAGAISEETHRQRVQALLSTQTAVAGASGADVGSQSFGKVMDQTATLGELDSQTIRMNALRDAWGLKTQALGLNYQGQAAKAAGYSGAFGTALTGFGSAYGAAKTAGGTSGNLKWW